MTIDLSISQRKKMVLAALRVIHDEGIKTRQHIPKRTDRPRDPQYEQATRTIDNTLTDRMFICRFDPTRMSFASRKADKLNDGIENEALRRLGWFDQSLPVRCDVAGGKLNVQFALPDPPTLYWRDFDEGSDVMLLGEDPTKPVNNRVAFDLGSVDLGLLIVAPTGGGKTNAARVIALQAIRSGWRCYLLGMKGRDNLEDIDALSYRSAFNNADAGDVIAELQRINDDRNDGRASKEPPVLIFWDEVRRTTEDNQQALNDIIVAGRSANMRLVATTQTVDSDVTKDLRANMEHRLVFRVANATQSARETGHAGMGADRLQGEGDGLLVMSAYDVTRVQVPKADPVDVRADVEAILERRPRLAEPSRPSVWSLAESIRRADVAENSRRDPPPVVVICRALIWAIRHGEPPSNEYVDALNELYTGNPTVNPRIHKMLRRACNETIADLSENYGNDASLGGHFLQSQLEQPSYWYRSRRGVARRSSEYDGSDPLAWPREA